MDMNPPATIETPCIKVCVIEPDSGLCIGCGRFRQEIGGWLGFSTEQRRTVMASLPERLANLTLNKRRRGGRRARLADPSGD
jgi:predicted Fe-S protein YdhL (DUF1289 family)